MALLGLASLVSPPSLQGQTASQVDPQLCTKLCSKQPADKDLKSADVVEIDANTGAVLKGSDEYPNGTHLRIYVVKKNPFKYTYRIKVQSRLTESALASAFLGLIPGMSDAIGKFQPSTETPATHAKGLLLESAPPPCTDDPGLKEFENLHHDGDARLAEGEAIKDKLAELAKKHDTIKDLYQSAYDNINKYPEEVDDCRALCESVTKAYPELRTLELGDLRSKVDSFKSGASDLVNRVEIYKKDHPSCSNEKDVAAQLQAYATLKADAEAYDKALKIIEADKKKFEHLADIIDDVFAQSSPFVYVDDPPTGGRPKTVSIEISRRDLWKDGAQYEPVKSLEIQVGESVLSLSGGIGFSTIGDVKVVRQAGMVPDPNDSTKKVLGTIFGYQSNSSFKPAGVVMLNGMPWRSGGVGLGVSAGLVISNRNDTAEPEFICGFTLGFGRNTVLLTTGFHAARKEKLAGGFNIGDPVPSDLQDPLPIEKSFAPGLMVTITFKLK